MQCALWQTTRPDQTTLYTGAVRAEPHVFQRVASSSRWLREGNLRDE